MIAGCGLRIGEIYGGLRDGDDTLRSGVHIHRCFVMLGGLRYNRCDLMEMKCDYSYFRVIFQSIHIIPEFIIERKSL